MHVRAEKGVRSFGDILRATLFGHRERHHNCMRTLRACTFSTVDEIERPYIKIIYNIFVMHIVGISHFNQSINQSVNFYSGLSDRSHDIVPWPLNQCCLFVVSHAVDRKLSPIWLSPIHAVVLSTPTTK